MASEVTVANIALSLLGEPQIVSLSEDADRARKINTRFEDVRDATLRAHPWDCAEARAQLANDGTTPVFGFTFSFDLPSDFLIVRRLEVHTAKWKIEGKKLLAEDSPAKILYTKRVTDPNTWDALFIQVFGARLAYEVCESITKDTALKTRLWDEYKQKIDEAARVDGQQGTQEFVDEHPFITERL